MEAGILVLEEHARAILLICTIKIYSIPIELQSQITIVLRADRRFAGSWNWRVEQRVQLACTLIYRDL